MLNKFVVIDLETTGNLPKKGDRVIQFAAVVVENGEVVETYSSLVKPNMDIPPFIEELTGINNRMVEGAPEFATIAPKIVELLDGAFFVAHNVLFDLSFLQEELQNAGFAGYFGPVLDTVEMARILFPTADGYKLTDLAEMENLTHDRPHQADSDAEVTAQLFIRMLERFKQLPLKTLSWLSKLSGGLKSDLDQLLDVYLLEKESRHEVLPDHLEYVQELAIRKLPELIPAATEQDIEEYPIQPSEKIRILEKAQSPFTLRSGQFHMMDEVYLALQSGVHTLIEAGTGIGKSLGYLLPAAYFSKSIQEPIVISTHTIQLQEQLLVREVPKLESILRQPVKVALLKGRNHYLHLEKFIVSLQDWNDNYDTTLTKMQLLIWLTETETGDRDELNLSSGGQIYWQRIKNNANVLSVQESLRSRDFYSRAKQKANEADLIITNHSLLLRDAVSQSDILPTYSYAIVDEAHHIEKAAAAFLGETLDYMSVRLMLAQVGSYDQKQMFYRFERLFQTLEIQGDDVLHTTTVNQLVSDLSYEVDEFFKLIAHYVQKETSSHNRSGKVKVRLIGNQGNKAFSALKHSGERFAFLLKDFLAILQQRVKLVETKKAELTGEAHLFLSEYTAQIAQLDRVRQSLYSLILKENELVIWLEVDFRAPQNATSVYAQPPSVAEYLRLAFFEKKKSVVLTSATLAVNGSFHYIMRELGLRPGEVNEVCIPSPFPYKQQVKLLVPKDIPDIKAVDSDEYVLAITEQIITYAEATKGRMLLLFTSYDMLKKTYNLIKESGFLDDFALIAQGITSGSRTRLTRNFTRYDKAILLGTSSFWEGIDIPGEDLSCLVIVRLPFSPPTDPYTEAKSEYIKRQGGNPFYDFSLPEAILRFKQGFGRLIRSESDRGVIIVFDRRIITTKYGKAFLKSIPDISVKEDKTDTLVDEIQSWLKGKEKFLE